MKNDSKPSDYVLDWSNIHFFGFKTCVFLEPNLKRFFTDLIKKM